MKTIWLESIDSTNSEAVRRLPELSSGTVLAARGQTAGRGQRGNSWFTEPGKNLTFSIVLKDLPLKASEGVRLGFLASLAVERYLASRGVKSAIKWPNDIYVGDRKICGMLIENKLSPEGLLQAAIIGVGINVNQKVFPQLATATSLSLCTGEEYLLDTELEAFLEVFEDLLPRLSSDELLEGYNARLYRKGVPARYHDLLTGREYEGVIESALADGRLRVKEQGGEEHFYRFKELSYIL